MNFVDMLSSGYYFLAVMVIYIYNSPALDLHLNLKNLTQIKHIYMFLAIYVVRKEHSD